ncbi:MAG: KilA-N domain-containing protein [Candidatus Gracilibacteria bacterium]|jgi:hypothetical protein
MKNDRILNVKGIDIALISIKTEDYISLTDMAKSFGGEIVICNWMRSRNTLEFLGIWEYLHNSEFKSIEFDGFKKEAGLNRFTMSSRKWIKSVNAIGLISKAGRYGGGTFAHKDIAFEFGSWLSPEFKLYLIKEFQRLKEEENKTKSLEWDLSRNLAKINYKIHTNAIKEKLIPVEITKEQESIIYANEADVLNMALFGRTAKQWKAENAHKEGNIRDYATVEQLVVLANLESLNSVLIKSGIAQPTRLKELNKIAIDQMKTLIGTGKNLLREKR